MSIAASASHEENNEPEIYPNIAALVATYGDKNGTYLNFVKKHRPGFLSDPYILVLWNQPWGKSFPENRQRRLPLRTNLFEEHLFSEGLKVSPGNSIASSFEKDVKIIPLDVYDIIYGVILM